MNEASEQFRIDSMKIENIRRFEAFEIDLEPDLTVLTGDNATGKTTLLECLAVLASVPFVEFPHTSSKTLRLSDVRETVTSVGSSFDRQLHLPARLSARGRFAGEPVEWGRSLSSTKRSRMTIADSKELLSRASSVQVSISQGSESTVLPIIALYGTDRLWGHSPQRRPSAAKTSSRMAGYSDCVSAGVDETGLYSWLEKVTLWELQNRKSSPELHAVKQAIASCLPHPEGGSDISVDYDLERRQLVLAYIDTSGEYRRDSLHSMSDGYRSTLSLVSDIARRMATLNPMLLDRVLETPGIVLIDEVDLHLHPLWQARILADLRRTFPQVQFVVSTHAPTIAASVNKRHLRLLGTDAAFAPSEETYGRDVNAIMNIVMGSSKRPQEVDRLFSAFYTLLDGEDYLGAEAKLDEIERRIGGTDAELVSARTALILERDV